MKILFSLVFIVFIITSLFCVDMVRERDKQIAEKLKDMGIDPYLVILLIATLPIIELRGAIPVGLLVFKELDPVLVIIFSIIGNMFPIFFILFLLGPVERLLRKIKIFDRFFDWLFKRTIARSKTIEKYEEFGLMLFVAIPAPITGAWTGSLASYLFKLSYTKSILFIFFGVLIAAAIVTTLSFYWQIGLAALGAGVAAFLYISISGLIRSVKERKESTTDMS